MQKIAIVNKNWFCFCSQLQHGHESKANRRGIHDQLCQRCQTVFAEGKTWRLGQGEISSENVSKVWVDLKKKINCALVMVKILECLF